MIFFLPLISIFSVYLAIALLKSYFRLKICAICAAVSFTWLLLLTLGFLNFNIPLNFIAVLMGMSITGLMYKLESLFKEHDLKNFFLVRLTVIIGGFYSVLSLLNEDWSLFLLILIFSVILILLTSLIFQPRESNERNKAFKKLDDCC